MSLDKDVFKVYDWDNEKDILLPAWFDLVHLNWCIVCTRSVAGHRIYETPYNYIILHRKVYWYKSTTSGKNCCTHTWNPIDSEDMNRYLSIFRRDGEILGAFTLPEAKYLLSVAQIGIGE